MKLHLDTSSRDRNLIRLDGAEIVASDIVGGIKKLLEARRISLEDIEKIEVFPGPGSFTGLRVGCAIGNALYYALGKLESYQDLVFPNYGKEPNISQRRG